jgi:hypothetical protein
LLDGILSDPDFVGASLLCPFLEAIKDPVAFWDKAGLLFDHDLNTGLQVRGRL